MPLSYRSASLPRVLCALALVGSPSFLAACNGSFGAPAVAPEAPPPAAVPELVAKVTEAWRIGDARSLAPAMADDVVFYPVGMPVKRGRADVVAAIGEEMGAHPGIHRKPARVWERPGRLVVEWVATSADLGKGAGAAVHPIGLRGATSYRLGATGLVQEQRDYFDMLTLRTQDGTLSERHREIVPAPSEVEVHVEGPAPGQGGERPLLQREREAISGPGGNAWTELFTADAVLDDFALPGAIRGRDAIQARFAEVARALVTPALQERSVMQFPHHLVVEWVASADVLASTATGAARHVEIPLLEVSDIVDDHVAYRRVYRDGAALREQLGR